MKSVTCEIDFLERRIIGVEAAMRYGRLPMFALVAAAFESAALRNKLWLIRERQNKAMRSTRGQVIPISGLN